MFKLHLEKVEEPEIKLPTSVGSLKKWDSSRKTSVAAAKLLQSCSILCYPIDGSPPGSPVPGILQARTLEWVAISFSNAWKWKVKVKSLSRVQLLESPWTVAHQAPPSMGFSRQEYWSGVPLPSPVDELMLFKWMRFWCRHEVCFLSDEVRQILLNYWNILLKPALFTQTLITWQVKWVWCSQTVFLEPP